jgi:hypothetical protein
VKGLGIFRFTKENMISHLTFENLKRNAKKGIINKPVTSKLKNPGMKTSLVNKGSMIG